MKHPQKFNLDYVKYLINKANLKHNNKYVYLIETYTSARKPMTIVCPLHGETKQVLYTHIISKTGCRKCMFESKKYNTKIWINKAKSVHNNIYDYSKVVYMRNDIPITIICKTHGEFLQNPTTHLTGAGCIKCKYYKSRKTESEFINKSKKMFNNKYTYNDVVYVTHDNEVTLRCCLHGDFKITPKKHFKNKYTGGCPDCINEYSKKKTTEEFIKESEMKYGNIFTYEKTKYIDARSKVKITCPKHGDFEQTPDRHLSNNTKYGCNKCGEDSTGNIRRRPFEEFLNRSNTTHNNKYDYSKSVYQNTDTPLTIICPTHGEYKQVPTVHMNGGGCYKCKGSNGEKIITEILIQNNIKFIREYKISGYRYRYDFYLPDLNIFIEYDGMQHFKPVEIFGGVKNFLITRKNDLIKNKLAKENKIHLIRIKYTEIKNIKSYIFYRISKIYKYRVENKWYKNFLDLCSGESMSNNIKVKDVVKYLTYHTITRT